MFLVLTLPTNARLPHPSMFRPVSTPAQDISTLAVFVLMVTTAIDAALKLGVVTAEQSDEWVRPEDMTHPLR